VRPRGVLLAAAQEQAVGVERDLEPIAPEVCEALRHVGPERGAAERQQDAGRHGHPPARLGRVNREAVARQHSRDLARDRVVVLAVGQHRHLHVDAPAHERH
jgi:hypothetical protein